MIKTNIVCDGCGKVIDPSQGYINLNPLRGGFLLAVGDIAGSSETPVTQNVNLCGGDCLKTFVGATHEAALARAAAAAAGRK